VASRTFGAPIGASLQSGEFEIVKDPFPSEKLPPARVLVLDRDEATTRALATLGEVEVVTASDGWSALELLVEGDFHLVLCALTFDGWRGSKLYSMVAKARPEMAARIVFLAMEADVAAAPPSSALGRVMARPVDPDAVRRLIARVQRGP
jgi:DNA-binding NtrC family response regulator